MRKLITRILSAVFIILTLGYNTGSAAVITRKKAHGDIFDANKLLARTINIGFALKPPQAGSTLIPIKASDILKIKQAGFTAIRLPVDWVSGMATQPLYQLRADLLAVVDNVLQMALKNDLAVIIDNHTDEQLMAQPALYRERFMSLWRQLSSHYRDYPPQVMFELMAEPHGQLDNNWNDFLLEGLKIVRVKNPGRPVIIGTVSSNRPQAISSLGLPDDDRNIIVTFHQYSPIQFTMQGEAWFPIGKPMDWLGTKWPTASNNEIAVTRLMDMVSTWADKNKRPVFMGEFGVSANADTASAVRWIKCNREEAEKRNFSWGYWSTLSVNFSLIDPATGDWRNSYLSALMPGLFHPDTNKKPSIANSLKPAPGMTAQLVMEKCINAMGGKKAIAGIKDIELKGTALMSGTTLTIDQTYILPDGFAETVSVNGAVYQHTVMKPDMVDVTLQGNHKQPTAEELETLREKLSPFPEIYFLSHPEYLLSLEGIVTEGNENLYVVKIHSPLGREFVNYYSVRTNLRQKKKSIQQSPSDPLTETIYAGYQKIGGVLLPRSVTNNIGQLSIAARFEISVNTGLVITDLR